MNQRQTIFSTSTAFQTQVMSGGVWNEMLDKSGNVRPHWADMEKRVQSWTGDEKRELQQETRRVLEALGATFNVYRDVGGAGQPYEIDPIPLILDSHEWKMVSKGLAQRMNLLEAVLKDLYGPRLLLKDGLLPPDLVHASPSFHQSTRDIQPVGSKWLLACGCDLVRSETGVWTVMRDHTQMPGGLGQTLENRSVVSSVLPDLFESAKVTKLRSFFDAEHQALRKLSTSRGEVSNVIFLTPGFHHPSYFEHAYKARLLGISLVEAADLTVRERRLFLKTLGGLRRVDGVMCRLDDDGIDPLEFWTTGGGGVPGLIEAWRTGNVVLLNAPGSGFAGSPALQAFLPLICRKWFGEELLLPFVESWWLGQKSIREKLLKDLSGYVLLPAYGKDSLLPVKWDNLSAASRKQWLAEISRRPWDFVVQRDVNPSTVPTLQGRFIQDKSVVLRAFTLNANGGPMVLPGGLARIGKPGVPPQLWPDHQGFTKDVWLTGNTSEAQATEASPLMTRDRLAGTAEVPSRIAEQLYWVGRYAERLESLTRMLRVTMRCMEGENGRRQYDQLDACLRLMDGAGAPGKDLLKCRSIAELSQLIFSKEIPGSLTQMANALIGNAAGARDRISDDTWICFNQLKGILDGANRDARSTDLLRTLDRMVLQLSAFSGLQAENMIRGHGWRFLETGRRIERAQTSLGLLQASKDDQAMLEPLIEICDSVMTYRRRYFSRPEWEGVLELLFFDRSNPRSVGYQMSVMCRELNHFPGDPELGLFPRIKNQMGEIDTRISDLTSPTAKELDELGDRFGVVSDLITQHYFSHSVRRVY